MIINDFWLYENERQSTFLGLYVPQSLRMTATAPTILLSLPPITPPIPITCLHRYCWHCHHHQYHAAVPFTTAATTITVTITTTYADCAATTEAATTTITRFQRLWMPFLGNHNSSCRIMVPNIVPVIVVIVIILIVVVDSTSLTHRRCRCCRHHHHCHHHYHHLHRHRCHHRHHGSLWHLRCVKKNLGLHLSVGNSREAYK